MMAFVRQGQSKLRSFMGKPWLQAPVRGAIYFLSGFCLSAASLGNSVQPVAAGFVCACTGGVGALSALGASVGYLLFWQQWQPVAWCGFCLFFSVFFSNRTVFRDTRLLLPVSASMTVAVCGVIFQWAQMDDGSVLIYLIRVGMASVSTAVFAAALRRRTPLAQWLCCSLFVLALAQILPVPYLGLGYVAAGVIVMRGTFPGAALAGLALDLAGITTLPITAVVCCTYLVRFLPHTPQWLGGAMIATVSVGMMFVTGNWDLYPLPGLFFGAILGACLPGERTQVYRRGETGLLQVRLELAAGVMAQTEQILSETQDIPVDEDGLVSRAAEAACGGCPCRKNCKDSRRLSLLPGLLLHKSLTTVEELPIQCRKSSRFLAELHRSQEQYRSILADRERQREYREAVLQQYRFLSCYLSDLSDQLSSGAESIRQEYSPVVEVFGNRPETGNGDKCLRFMGTGGKYYVLLCDGMGTGPGASREARVGGDILRRLLCAGFPAEYALGTLNSICALRERAGALTVDMAELDLDSGQGRLYKWGAPPSYVLRSGDVEKIGTISPPPGISLRHQSGRPSKVSLHQGEYLVMVSDGVGEDGAYRCCMDAAGMDTETLAGRLLACGAEQGEDDSTAVILRLRPVS